MIVAINKCHWAAPADEMQLLIYAQTEPCAWKIKRRSWQRLQPQHVPIKRGALFHIRNVDGHMIQFVDLHSKNVNGQGDEIPSGIGPDLCNCGI